MYNHVRLISKYFNHQDQNYSFLQHRFVISILVCTLEAKKRDTSIDIVTGEELEHRASITRMGNRFTSSSKSRPIRGSSQLSFKTVPWVKRPGREGRVIDHSPSYSTDF